MNKFTLSALVAILFALGTLSTSAHSPNWEPLLAKPAISGQPVAVGITPFDPVQLYGKNVKNRLQKVDWIIFDSLANSLSYHTPNTTPYIWNPEFNALVTVKRGSHNPNDAGVSKDNSKNNLFIRISYDKGKSWEPNPILVYDNYEENFGGARYPSIASFNYSGQLALAYTTSMVFEDQGVWKGYITGIYGESLGGSANMYTPTCRVNNIDYTWGNAVGNFGVSDASIIGGMQGQDLYLLATGSLASPTRDKTDNNNFGIRKSIELNEPTFYIPTAWTSNKFYDVDTTSTRSNESIGIRNRQDGAIYFGIAGNFRNPENIQNVKLGFSFSTDQGNTWSEFKYSPNNLFRDYGVSIGLVDTTAMIGYHSKDFTVLANGDVYFSVYFFENSNAKIFAELQHQLLSVKYTAATDSWSLSKISDLTGLTISMLDDNNNPVGNSVDFDIEMAKTVDESSILVKFVDILGVNWVTDSTYNFQTNDIFVSTHKIGSAIWSTPVNVTEDAIYNLNTHIPEIVPDGMTGMPIMQTHTILLEGEDTGSAYASAARHYIRSQWVMAGQFDAVVGVNDEETAVSGMKINRIFPNPAQDGSRIDFTTVGSGNVDIIVTDLLGNNVMTIFSGLTEEGAHSFNFDTNKLMNGSYYVTLKSGISSVTELITVVR